MDQGRRRSEPAELFAVLILGLLLRLFAGRNSLTENGVLLPGYDEYYHMRRILFTANHFPNTLWFDSYLNYPQGLEITWPPLFDQISAALCVAFGQHSKAGVEMVACLCTYDHRHHSHSSGLLHSQRALRSQSCTPRRIHGRPGTILSPLYDVCRPGSPLSGGTAFTHHTPVHDHGHQPE